MIARLLAAACILLSLAAVGVALLVASRLVPVPEFLGSSPTSSSPRGWRRGR
jgi:hypothetical protein